MNTDYRVVLLDMPVRRAFFSVCDPDGFATIFVNGRLAEEQRLRAVRQALLELEPPPGRPPEIPPRDAPVLAIDGCGIDPPPGYPREELRRIRAGFYRPEGALAARIAEHTRAVAAALDTAGRIAATFAPPRLGLDPRAVLAAFAAAPGPEDVRFLAFLPAEEQRRAVIWYDRAPVRGFAWLDARAALVDAMPVVGLGPVEAYVDLRLFGGSPGVHSVYLRSDGEMLRIFGDQYM